ncbi:MULTISPECIES: Wzz/FepE/Etk N-terminal domain-containing protein [Paenibacillus]|uniref:Wzz/FepE/Etk N-terminal domain-containing protein n=1 Tax=Paenibacillus TaxID=44249 RepID=UPI0022B90806|nr:Wzz/FepE/Etk N-terminal domain-containing protein [Paenibacillus caseinilyticus]MCZ8523107.1 Wzz/FepE/Etk N-terminal domain-containing protein [Paenibacillus caseinilyticus]
MANAISMKSIVNTIRKNKKIALQIILTLTIFSIVYNYFIVKPTFESTALVIINNQFEDNTEKVIQKDLTPYVEQVTSDYTLTNMIQKLNLEQPSYNLNTLKNIVDVKSEKNSNLITINIRSSNAEIARNIANYLALQVGVNVEVSDYNDKIVIYKNNLLKSEDLLKQTQSQFDNASTLLKQTPEKLTTIKTLSSDPLFQSIITDIQRSKNSQALQYTDEEINPAHTSLSSTLSEISINLSKYKSEVQANSDRIKEFETHTNDIQSKLTADIINKNSTSWFSDGFKAVMINPALTPATPVAPKKSLNIAITFIVSLLLSLLVIYIKEFFKQS